MAHIKIDNFAFTLLNNNKEPYIIPLEKLYDKVTKQYRLELLQNFAEKVLEEMLKSKELRINDYHPRNPAENRPYISYDDDSDKHAKDHNLDKKYDIFFLILGRQLSQKSEICCNIIDLSGIIPFLQELFFKSINNKITTNNTHLKIYADPNVIINKIKKNKDLFPKNLEIVIKKLEPYHNILSFFNTLGFDRHRSSSSDSSSSDSSSSDSSIAEKNRSIIVKIEKYSSSRSEDNIVSFLRDVYQLGTAEKNQLQLEINLDNSKDIQKIIQTTKNFLIPRNISIGWHDSKGLYSLKKALTENNFFHKLYNTEEVLGTLLFVKICPDRKEDVANYLERCWSYHFLASRSYYTNINNTAQYRKALIDMIPNGTFHYFHLMLDELLDVFTPKYLNTMMMKSLKQYSNNGRLNGWTTVLIKKELSAFVEEFKKQLLEITTERKSPIREDILAITADSSTLSSHHQKDSDRTAKTSLLNRINNLAKYILSASKLDQMFSESFQQKIQQKLFCAITSQKDKITTDDFENNGEALRNIIAETVEASAIEAKDFVQQNLTNTQKNKNKKKLQKQKKWQDSGHDDFENLSLPKDITINAEDDLFQISYDSNGILGIKVFIDLCPHRKNYVIEYLKTNWIKWGLTNKFCHTSQEYRAYLVDLLSEAPKLKNIFKLLDIPLNIFSPEYVSSVVEKNLDNQLLNIAINNLISEELPFHIEQYLWQFENHLKSESRKNLPVQENTRNILKYLLSMQSTDVCEKETAEILLPEAIKKLNNYVLSLASDSQGNFLSASCLFNAIYDAIKLHKAKITTDDDKKSREEFFQIINETLESIKDNLKGDLPNLHQQEEPQQMDDDNQINSYVDKEMLGVTTTPL